MQGKTGPAELVGSRSGSYRSGSYLLIDRAPTRPIFCPTWNFYSQAHVDSFCSKLGVAMYLIFTSDYVLFRCIVKLTGSKGDDWDERLETILFGIRTPVQETTKFIHFLMHKREATN